MLLHMKQFLCCCLFAGFVLYDAGAQPADRNNIKILESKKIWPGESHSAFTDLERFQDKWYCAFRIGKGHAGKGDYGKIRVIVSDDGQSWRRGFVQTALHAKCPMLLKRLIPYLPHDQAGCECVRA